MDEDERLPWTNPAMDPSRSVSFKIPVSIQLTNITSNRRERKRKAMLQAAKKKRPNKKNAVKKPAKDNAIKVTRPKIPKPVKNNKKIQKEIKKKQTGNKVEKVANSQKDKAGSTGKVVKPNQTRRPFGATKNGKPKVQQKGNQ